MVIILQADTLDSNLHNIHLMAGIMLCIIKLAIHFICLKFISAKICHDSILITENSKLIIFPGDGTGQNFLYSTLKNKICLCQLIWFQAVSSGPITSLLDTLFPEKLDHFCSDFVC
jgi:hypothetical protein